MTARRWIRRGTTPPDPPPPTTPSDRTPDDGPPVPAADQVDVYPVVPIGPVRAEAGPAARSFAPFFLEEHPRLVALVLALTGDRAHAEDVAQEALLRTYRRWATVGGYDKPGAWTRRVAINLATSALRRRRTERIALARLAARTEPAAPTGDGDADFWAMVRTLPRRQATAAALRYLDDASIADIAAVMGCAEGTAKSHLRHARAALAARFGDPDPDPPSDPEETR